MQIEDANNNTLAASQKAKRLNDTKNTTRCVAFIQKNANRLNTTINSAVKRYCEVEELDGKAVGGDVRLQVINLVAARLVNNSENNQKLIELTTENCKSEIEQYTSELTDKRDRLIELDKLMMMDKQKQEMAEAEQQELNEILDADLDADSQSLTDVKALFNKLKASEVIAKKIVELSDGFTEEIFIAYIKEWVMDVRKQAIDTQVDAANQVAEPEQDEVLALVGEIEKEEVEQQEVDPIKDAIDAVVSIIEVRLKEAKEKAQKEQEQAKKEQEEQAKKEQEEQAKKEQEEQEKAKAKEAEEKAYTKACEDLFSVENITGKDTEKFDNALKAFKDHKSITKYNGILSQAIEKFATLMDSEIKQDTFKSTHTFTRLNILRGVLKAADNQKNVSTFLDNFTAIDGKKLLFEKVDQEGAEADGAEAVKETQALYEFNKSVIEAKKDKAKAEQAKDKAKEQEQEQAALDELAKLDNLLQDNATVSAKSLAKLELAKQLANDKITQDEKNQIQTQFDTFVDTAVKPQRPNWYSSAVINLSTIETMASYNKSLVDKINEI